jgi:hypothetical protein
MSSPAMAASMPAPGQGAFDGAGAHAHAEGVGDRAGEVLGPQPGVGGQLLFGERAHLVGELVPALGAGLGRGQGGQAAPVERDRGVVAGLPGTGRSRRLRR